MLYEHWAHNASSSSLKRPRGLWKGRATPSRGTATTTSTTSRFSTPDDVGQHRLSSRTAATPLHLDGEHDSDDGAFPSNVSNASSKRRRISFQSEIDSHNDYDHDNDSASTADSWDPSSFSAATLSTLPTSPSACESAGVGLGDYIQRRSHKVGDGLMAMAIAAGRGTAGESSTKGYKDWEDLKDMFSRAAEKYELSPPADALAALRGVMHACHEFLVAYDDPSKVFAIPSVPTSTRSRAAQYSYTPFPEQSAVDVGDDPDFLAAHADPWLRDDEETHLPRDEPFEWDPERTRARSRSKMRADVKRSTPRWRYAEPPTSFHALYGTTLFLIGNLRAQEEHMRSRSSAQGSTSSDSPLQSKLPSSTLVFSSTSSGSPSTSPPQHDHSPADPKFDDFEAPPTTFYLAALDLFETAESLPCRTRVDASQIHFSTSPGTLSRTGAGAGADVDLWAGSGPHVTRGRRMGREVEEVAKPAARAEIDVQLPEDWRMAIVWGRVLVALADEVVAADERARERKEGQGRAEFESERSSPHPPVYGYEYGNVASPLPAWMHPYLPAQPAFPSLQSQWPPSRSQQLSPFAAIAARRPPLTHTSQLRLGLGLAQPLYGASAGYPGFSGYTPYSSYPPLFAAHSGYPGYPPYPDPSQFYSPARTPSPFPYSFPSSYPYSYSSHTPLDPHDLLQRAADQFARGIFHMPHPEQEPQVDPRLVNAVPAPGTAPHDHDHTDDGTVQSPSSRDGQISQPQRSTFSRARELYTLATDVLMLAERLPPPSSQSAVSNDTPPSVSTRSSPGFFPPSSYLQSPSSVSSEEPRQDPRIAFARLADAVFAQMRMEADTDLWRGRVMRARGRCWLVLGSVTAEGVEAALDAIGWGDGGESSRGTTRGGERTERGGNGSGRAQLREDEAMGEDRTGLLYSEDAEEARASLGVAISFFERAKGSASLSCADGDNDDDGEDGEGGSQALYVEALLTLANLTADENKREELYARAQAESGGQLDLSVDSAGDRSPVEDNNNNGEDEMMDDIMDETD